MRRAGLNDEVLIMTCYRVLFETVNLDRLAEFCDRDPARYRSRDVHQVVPNSEIPEDAWHPVTGVTTSDPWDQYGTLRLWAAEDREFVRNIRLERLAAEETWEEVQP
jgi:hypothetical protein